MSAIGSALHKVPPNFQVTNYLHAMQIVSNHTKKRGGKLASTVLRLVQSLWLNQRKKHKEHFTPFLLRTLNGDILNKN